MKNLNVRNHMLFFVNNNAVGDRKENTLIGSLDDGQVWLKPQELLQVRDWVNERCRELMFQGHLPESHPTA